MRAAWIAVGYPFASVPARCQRQRCWKRDSGDATTARLSDLSRPLTDEVRREPSPRISAAADREKRQICTTCLFADGVVLVPSPIVRVVQRQRCWKRGSGDGQRLSLYDYGRTERSFNAVERPGEVRRSPEQSARQPIERSGKFVQRAYSRRALDCAYALISPVVHDVQRQRYWKRGSGDRQRLSLHDYGTAERSFNCNAVERQGSTVT